MTSQAKIHLVLTYAWGVMIVPTVLIFKDSVLWVAAISIYALVASHWSAYEAAKAGMQKVTLNQIRALTDALADFMEVYHEDAPDERLERSVNELRATIANDADAAERDR